MTALYTALARRRGHVLQVVYNVTKNTVGVIIYNVTKNTVGVIIYNVTKNTVGVIIYKVKHRYITDLRSRKMG